MLIIYFSFSNLYYTVGNFDMLFGGEFLNFCFLKYEQFTWTGSTDFAAYWIAKFQYLLNTLQSEVK